MPSHSCFSDILIPFRQNAKRKVQCPENNIIRYLHMYVDDSQKALDVDGPYNAVRSWCSAPGAHTGRLYPERLRLTLANELEELGSIVAMLVELRKTLRVYSDNYATFAKALHASPSTASKYLALFVALRRFVWSFRQKALLLDDIAAALSNRAKRAHDDPAGAEALADLSRQPNEDPAYYSDCSLLADEVLVLLLSVGRTRGISVTL